MEMYSLIFLTAGAAVASILLAAIAVAIRPLRRFTLAALALPAISLPLALIIRWSVLDSGAANIFRLLHRFLDRCHCFFEIDDHALARTPRLRNSMPAIAQAGVRGLCHQHAGLGATYIDCRQKILLLIRHAYWWSSPLAIAGLGLFPGFTATVPVPGSGAGVVFPDAVAADVLAAGVARADGD